MTLPDYLRIPIRDPEFVVPNYGDWYDKTIYLSSGDTAESEDLVLEYVVDRHRARCDYDMPEFEYLCVRAPGHGGFHIPMRVPDWSRYPIVVRRIHANRE